MFTSQQNGIITGLDYTRREGAVKCGSQSCDIGFLVCVCVCAPNVCQSAGILWLVY